MEEWDPGVVYMAYTESGQKTLSMHRCWNAKRFKHARMEQAAAATAKKKPSIALFLTEDEYRKAGGR